MSMQRLGARALVSLSLAGSGLLAVAGARERWWPACRRGDYDTPRCLALQDDRYDYTAMREPWVPLGNAAELAGLSYAALALAVGLLPWLLMPSRTRLAWAASAVLGGTLIPLAAVQWFSGRAGEVVASPLLVPVGVAWTLLWPLAVLAVVCLPTRFGDPTAVQRGARVLLATLLCLSSPLGQFLAAPVMVGYVSHDTAPWTEATTGLLLLAAALAVWPATGARAPGPGARGGERPGPPGVLTADRFVGERRRRAGSLWEHGAAKPREAPRGSTAARRRTGAWERCPIRSPPSPRQPRCTR